MHIVKLIRKKPKVKGVLKLETSRIKVKGKHCKSKKNILQAKSLVARGKKLLTCGNRNQKILKLIRVAS